MYRSVVEAWQIGLAAGALAARSAGLRISPRQLGTLAAALARANGGRKVRLLEPANIFEAIAVAMTTAHGIGIVHGGWANADLQHTTLCLAFRDGPTMAVGVGLSKARTPGPGMTWQQLQPWSAIAPERNLERLRAWAKATSAAKPADRVAFAVTRPVRGPVTDDTREALVAAILADPSDDASREVLADRLLELGDPRGEFILVQLALSRAVPGSEPRARLAAASATLEKRYGATWRRPVAQLTLRQWFRRGFIADVEMRDQAFLRDGARLFELAPIERVRLRRSFSGFRKLGATPWLARVRELSLDVHLYATDAGELASGGRLHELRGFKVRSIYGVGLGAVLEAAPALAWLAVDELRPGVASRLLHAAPRVVLHVCNNHHDAELSALEAEGRLRREPP